MKNNDYEDEFQEAKNILGKFVLYVVCAIMMLSVVSLGWNFVVKRWQTNADRIIFKESLNYNEGVLDDLVKYKLEMIQAETDVEKKAIANMVVDRFANYDESKIESNDLKQFLKDCKNLNLDNY